ncbi:MAG TPA: sugar kinase [Clostridium sp.]
MSLDVVTFGESMAMFIADQVGQLHKATNFTLALSGAETNVAVGLSRLGYKVGWASKVGEDPFGKFIMESLQKEGVDTTCVSVDQRYPTGFQLKSKVLMGDPEVKYYRKGSAASTLAAEDIVSSYFTNASHLHMTGIPPALSESTKEFAKCVLGKMKAAKGTISFDPNLRPKLWSSQKEMVTTINELAVQADWVLPGLSEGEILTGYSKPKDIAAYYLDRGVKVVVIKLGTQGAYYRTATEENIIPGFKVKKVVDTVGAGDGFAVGFISGLLDGLSLKEAAIRANAIGALAVMSSGDMEGLPTRQQLETFITNNKWGV